jgi:hypothetical protein
VSDDLGVGRSGLCHTLSTYVSVRLRADWSIRELDILDEGRHLVVTQGVIVVDGFEVEADDVAYCVDGDAAETEKCRFATVPVNFDLNVPVANGDQLCDGVTAAVASHDAKALTRHHVPDADLTIARPGHHT